MSCNFIHYLMTYFGGYDCHLSQLSPKSPISVLPITLHRYTLSTLQTLAMHDVPLPLGRVWKPGSAKSTHKEAAFVACW